MNQATFHYVAVVKETEKLLMVIIGGLFDLNNEIKIIGGKKYGTCCL